tara:strand:- start:335 stop:3682 length:3348 start_codon:yes stop_codon:yes gene_type:complete
MINKILSKYRRLKVRQDLIKDFLKITFFLISFLSFFMFLEHVFFLEKIVRYRIFLTLTSFTLILFAYIVIKIILNLGAINQNFSNEKLAEEIGLKIPSFSDRIINILQLSKIQHTNKTEKELAKIAIIKNEIELEKVDLDTIITKISSKKIISAISFLFAFLFLLFFMNDFSNTINRIYNYDKEYPPPLPFIIIENTDSNSQIHEGEDKVVTFSILGAGKHPEELVLYFQQKDKVDSVLISSNKTNFQHTFENIRKDIQYWASYENSNIISAWDKIESTPNFISVIKRPILTEINFEIIYPSYVKKQNNKIKGNTIQFSALKNSNINCKISSNQQLDFAYLNINNVDTLILEQASHMWEGTFQITEDVDIEIIGATSFKDKNIINENPPIYSIKSYNDYVPEINIIKPKDNTFEIRSDNKIPLYFELVDDFKLTKSWVEYSILKPNYIESDSTINSVIINEYKKDIKFITENYIFNTNSLSTFPGDKIKFRVCAKDNNPSIGISKSKFFYAIIPSFDDILENMIKNEDEIQDASNDALNQVQDLEKKLDNMKLDMLKSTSASWEHQKQGEDALQQMENLFDEIEKMQNALNNLQEEAEKGNLIDQELVEKFDNFQELLDSIMTPELMEALQKMQEAMESMDLEKMLEATENFDYNLQQFEQQIDRFIEMFELALAEQKLDELVANLSALTQNQERIKSDIDNNTPCNQLENDQNRQNEDYKKFKNSMKEASNILKKFSDDTSQSLDDLSKSELSLKTQKSLNDSKSNLSKNDTQNASKSISESAENLKSMLESIEKIKDSFKNESIQKMSQEFYAAISNILRLSNNQENLLQNFKSIRSSSPQLKLLTSSQFEINKQFANFIGQLFELSTKTFHITPNINQKIGFCKKSIDKSIINLEQRKIKTSINEQKNIIGSMNEITLMLINSMNNMQNTGSAAGLESYLEQLEKIGQGQSEINMGTMQLGQMGMMSQQEMMKRLQSKQEALKEQLEQLIEDMPGNQGQGGLSKALEEMDEVIRNFQQDRVNNETKDKQQKILSRLLDSQKSIKERDYSDKRKGSIAEDIEYNGPSDLPTDLGEKNSTFINAMEKALEQNYSKEYEEIIKVYFKELQEKSND